MRTGLLAFLLLCSPLLSAWGQSVEELRSLHAGLATCEGDACRVLSDSLASALEAHLLEEGAWDRPSGTAGFMATVESADGRLKVMTWNWPHEDRTSSYGGLVAFRDHADDGMDFTRLHDASSADRPDENRILKPEDWCGALYTEWPDAVDPDVWLLLGWDDADAQVTRKSSSRSRCGPKGPASGRGSPVPSGLRRRHVLEYADAVQASLRHQPEARGQGIPSASSSTTWPHANRI